MGLYPIPVLELLKGCAMKQAATKAIVSGEMLIFQEEAREIAVGSSAWYGWLERAHSFSFKSSEGTFTAHKARPANQRGGWYWYAYRRRHGRLYRSYLGASSSLTLERLQQAARQLVDQSVQPSSPATTEQPSTKEPRCLLLPSKFQIPSLPAHYVARSRLITALNHLAHARLTLVSAPAGSGKTTLLAAWARASTLPIAWLSLEAADNDPLRFLSYLITALARLDAHLTELTALITPDISWEDVLTRLLANLARALTGDAVLILDDYHSITNASIHAELQFVIDHAPPQLHLMIGTRSDPPLSLPRLRAHSQLRQLETDELRFSSTELQAFFRELALDLSREEQQAIEQRTQGWIVGAQLLALGQHNHKASATLHQTTPGVHCFFVEYVTEEILAQQPAHIRNFLVHTSILERLTDSLCRAVTGRSDSPRLPDLSRSNLLLQAVDDIGLWYRYHPLFAEVMRIYLRTEEPEMLPELYRRASAWYQQHDLSEEGRAYAARYAALASNIDAPIVTGNSSATPHTPLLDPLSAREQEVLHMLAEGLSNQQIADQLIISLHTVKLHVKHILAKLAVSNRTQAVARARELQMLP
jgi:LuxR family maltose regulon positive regulatory protein